MVSTKIQSAYGVGGPIIPVMPIPVSAERAPVNGVDVYFPQGQLWFNNGVKPAVEYVYVGGGIWQTGVPGSLSTLSSQGGAATPPSGSNFNFSGSIAGGSAANGAIQFITPGGPGASANGQMDAKVLVDGTTITINGSNQLQAVNTGAFVWTVITASQSAVKGNGYFANGASGPIGVVVTLPTVSSVGDTFAVYNFNGNGFAIAQNAGQSIQLGNLTTTTGTSGSIGSVSIGDSVELVCSIDNTKWEVVYFNGNPGVA